MRTFRTSAIVLVAIVMIMTTVGAFATWRYAEGPPNPVENDVALSIVEFTYKPEEILPGGSNQQAQLGQNHVELITIIVEEVTYGLNSTAGQNKQIIHKNLINPGDVLYCDQHTTGGNLNKLMVEESDNAQQLYFVIKKISDTEYHTFTMKHSDIEKAVYTEIEVYLTVMEKGTNGIWVAARSYVGTARVSAPGKVPKAIDVNSFVYSTAKS